jgi:hypothetical protein
VIEAPYIRRERTFVCIFLFAMCLVLAHFVHDAWFTSTQAMSPQPVAVKSILHAPDAYRVAIPALVQFLQKTFHVADWTSIYGVLDFCFAFPALFLLYRLTTDDLTLPAVDFNERLATVAMFLAFLQFPMVWVVPWQRPETMPSALYLALALFCVSQVKRQGKWFALVLVATAVQAFVRSDVPFVFGVAMMLVSFGDSAMRPFEPRLASLLKSGCVVLVAAGVQLYLQFIRFPHLTYPPGTPVLQLGNNLRPHFLEVFAIALLPFLLLGLFSIYKRPRLRTVDALAVVAAALYLPLWFAVGNVGEVRLFVPFLLALCMVAARVFSSYLIGQVRGGEVL